MSGMTFELDTPHGRMMATMLAGIAQFERDLLSERVKSGLAAAKARGKKLGRQPGQRPKSDRLAPKVLHAIDGGEELPLDRPRPRDQQEHRPRHRQAASDKPLRFRPLPDSTSIDSNQEWTRDEIATEGNHAGWFELRCHHAATHSLCEL